MKKSLLFLISSCGLCLLNSCGGAGNPPPPPPAIIVALSPNSAQALDVNQSISLTANVSFDSSSQGVTWTVTCPAGVSACGAMAQANSASGVPNNFVAPANVSAAETVMVKATSVSDSTKFASIAVQVNPAFGLFSPPPAQPQPGIVGQSFSLNLMNYVQGGTAPFAWSVKSGILPAGLTLDPNTGLVSGTPKAAATAVAIVFGCMDSGNPHTTLPADLQISFTFSPPLPLSITSPAPPNGAVAADYAPHTGYENCVINIFRQRICHPCNPGGATATLPPCTPGYITYTTYGFLLKATGGVSPYTWTWAPAPSSSLPPGLHLSTGGFLSGTPPPAPSSIGSFNIVVTVTDSASPATQKAVPYLIVIAPPPPPVINTTPAPAIGTLSVAYVGYTFTAAKGIPPYTWTETGTLPATMAVSNAGVLSGTPSAAGSFPITLTAHDTFGQDSAPQGFQIEVLAKGFAPTSSLAEPRVLHMAALLTSGKVLITGGTNATAPPLTAELYDPAAGTFAPTKGSMGTSRESATATVLQSGKVLVIGGKGPNGNPLATAEIYDTATDSFTPTTGSMQSTRVYHTATLLNDGTVLVTGGLDVSGNLSGVPVATAELFDPATANFTPVANMGAARFFHAATLLASGKVLLTGGLEGGNGLTTAELYDPATKTFSLTIGNMTVGRAGHTATLVSGKVLVAGGAANFSGAAASTAELFDPAIATFSSTGAMVNGRSLHTATLLSNGQVLLAGGDVFFYYGAGSHSLSAAELFDPATGSFAPTADMTVPRESHTATLLLNGEVLVVGGANGTLGYVAPTTVFATAELYQ